MTYPYQDSAAPALPAAAEPDVYRKVTWRLIPFFCLCYLAAYLDRINVGLAKLQMLDDLKFSETIYGLGAGLFFVGYVLFEVPSNLILQKVGARIWIARIMVTWGLLSGATMLVTTPTQFYVLRFLLGAAEAGFLPGVLLYLTYWYPTHRRSKIIALFMMGLPLASMIGNPISGWIMTVFAGVNGWAGWQWLFLLEAVPSVMLGAMVFIYLPNGIADPTWLSDSEKRTLVRNLESDVLVENHHSLKAAFTDRRVWMLGIIDMCLLMGAYSIGFWMPTILRDSGVASPLHIGLLSAIPHAVAVVAMLLNGAHSDKTRERRWHIVIPILAGAIGLLGSTWFTANTGATVAFLTLANVGIVATFPVFWCLPGTFLSGKAAAAGIALACSIANLGGFAATYLLGWMKDVFHSPSAGLVLFAGCLVGSCFLVLAMPAKTVNR